MPSSLTAVDFPPMDLDAESETLFSLALSDSQLAICLTDPNKPDNPIIFANKAFSRLTGYARSDIIGQNCRFLQGKRTDPDAVQKIRDAIDKRSSTVIELVNYRKDGSAFINALHMGPIVEKDGTLRFFFGSQWDVTEDAKTKEIRRQRALAFAKIGVWEYTPKTQISHIDDQTSELFGMEKDGEIGLQQALEKIHPEDRERVEASINKALEDEDYQYHEQFRVMRADGSERWLLGVARSSTSLDDDGEVHLIGVNYDITPEKTYEAELIEAEKKIRLTAMELNHRIGNLFAVISSMVSMAARETDDAQEAADITRDRIHVLSKAHSLTNGLGLHTNTPLEEFFRAVFDLHIKSDRLRLNGPFVSLDSTYMTSLGLIFHELATNAVKYGGLSKEGGRVDVHWDREDDTLRIVWEEHSQKPVIAPEGEGFGSRLVKTSIKALKGQLDQDWRESGLTVTLTIPLED